MRRELLSSSSEEEEDDVRGKKAEEDPCCSNRCLLWQMNHMCMFLCASHVYFLHVKNKPHDELCVVRNFYKPLTMCSLTFCLVGCMHPNICPVFTHFCDHKCDHPSSLL
jgi:hypothetical protein